MDIPPWGDPNRPMGNPLYGEVSADKVAQLLQHDEMLPPPPPPITDQAAEYDDKWEREEDWLRELANRMEKHAAHFGASNRQVRREMMLASVMLDRYAQAWERHNKKSEGT